MPIGIPQLLFFGILVNEGVVLLLLQLPPEIARQIWEHVALPYVLTFAAATVLLGVMLQDLEHLVSTRLALESSEQRLRAIVEAIPDPLFVLDEDGRYVEVLATDANLLFAQTDQIVGKRMHDILPADDADRFLEAVKETLRGQSPKRMQYSLQTLGGLRHFEGHLQALAGAVDGRRAVVFLARDQTEFKRSNDAVIELARVTSAQNQRLRQFTYIISHNVRSHVANLLGLIQMQGPDADQGIVWPMICKSVRRLDEVIHHLNAVIQIQNQTPLPRCRVNLRQEIDKSLDALGPEVLARQARIIDEIPADLEIWVIPAYLDSILYTLLENALKYTPAGQAPEIRLGVEFRPGRVVLVIQDSGLGLDLEKAGDKLFGMYQTFHPQSAGKGLGLFLAKTQCEAMNCQIEVVSRPGAGATFKVCFATEPDAAQSAAAGTAS